MIEWHNWLQIAIVVAAGLSFDGWLTAHLFLHVKPSGLASFNDLTSKIGRGQPALIYFYSNF